MQQSTPPRVWSSDAHYFPPKERVRLISLKVQPEPLRRVIMCSRQELTKQALLQGFFYINDAEQTFITEVLAQSATKYGLTELA